MNNQSTGFKWCNIQRNIKFSRASIASRGENLRFNQSSNTSEKNLGLLQIGAEETYHPPYFSGFYFVPKNRGVALLLTLVLRASEFGVDASETCIGAWITMGRHRAPAHG